MRKVTRRRSPGWVRQMNQRQIHALAFRLQRETLEGVIHTDAQNWLWGCLISELEYRNRHARGPDRCWCPLCVPPDLDPG